MTKNTFLRSELTYICAILVLAFCLRLYRIHYPLLDWHSWRQADTASVTREYVKHSVDILRPTYHDLSNIPNYLDNSAFGYRMVEFPFVNASIATFLRVFPFLPLVPTSRFFSIMISLGTACSIFYLVKGLTGRKEAFSALFLFAVLPYSIYYSRTILPEPYMLFFSTFSLLSFYYWMKKGGVSWAVISALSLALAFLLKPFVVFLGPVYLALLILYKKNWYRPAFLLQLALYGVVSIVPLLLWRRWIAQYPEGIPSSLWLFNGNEIRFRPAWFRWLGYERLTKLFSGYIGILFLPLAFLIRQKATLVYLSWWIGIGIYFSVIATGNVQHDYYQNIMIPIFCITLSIGTWKMIELIENFLAKHAKKVSLEKRSMIAKSVVFIMHVMMIFFTWRLIAGYFNVNHWEYVETGKRADQLLPTDAKVIAPAFGDTIFLYQTNRTGWPIGFYIDEKISQGATHYVTTSYDDEARELERKYQTIEKTDMYLILDLTEPISQ